MTFNPHALGPCEIHPERTGRIWAETAGVRRFRCVECVEAWLAKPPICGFISKGDDWNCGPDNKLVGGSLYTRGGDGLYHCTERDYNERTWK